MIILVKYQLNGLRAVHALACHGTLASAARELCVSPGAISKHVLNIEQKIGHKLFERTTSGFQPIGSAHDFFDELNHAFQSLAKSLEKLDEDKDERIRISAAPSFARNWLIPRLPVFSESHPSIQISLEANREIADLSSGNFDCVIRFGLGNWRGADHMRIMDQLLFPTCSPKLLPILKTVKDIRKVSVITSEGIGINWRRWLQGNGMEGLEFKKQLSLFDEDLCLSAAINGLGVTLSWQMQAIDAIRQGLLVVPFGASVATGMSYWFLTPSGAKPSPSVRLFRDWLRWEIAACKDLFDVIPAPIERRTGRARDGS